MNLRLIEQFVAVAELGSLSKASPRLGIARPSRSRSWRPLESELNAVLFYRHGRGLALTDAGRVFLRHSKAALHELAQGKAEVSHLMSNPSGAVVIGLPPGVGKVAMVEIARRFAERLPSATLRIMEMFTGDVPEALAVGRIDIGVFYDHSTNSAVAAEPLLWEDLYLIGRAGAPATGEETIPFVQLELLPLILPARHQGVRGMIDKEAAIQGIKLSIKFELDAMPPLIEMVQTGLGYSVLPMASVFDFVLRNELQVSKIVSPNMTRCLMLGTSTQRPMSLAARSTLRLLREALHGSAAKAQWRPDSDACHANLF